MKQFIKDFKEFALRGNILDLAVGVVVGAAFNQIVTSFVNDIIMPLISRILNTSDIAKLSISLGNNTEGTEVLLRYGAFLQSMINFIIIAFSVFVALRLIMKLKREQKQETEVVKAEELVVLEEIRDLLRNK